MERLFALHPAVAIQMGLRLVLRIQAAVLHHSTPQRKPVLAKPHATGFFVLVFPRSRVQVPPGGVRQGPECPPPRQPPRPNLNLCS